MSDLDDSDDRNDAPSTSRRNYLGTLAGLAVTPALSAVGSAHSENVITIVGRGETAHYEFTASGDVEKVEENGGTINSYDQISGSTVTGRTTREPDSYAFDGEITDFETDAPVDVTINGQSADPAGGSGSSEESDESEETEEEEEDETDDVDASGYSNVVDIVEAGADNDGNASIHSVLNSVAGEDTLVKFPPGTYKMSGTLRVTGLEKFGMVGTDATIDVSPTNGYVCKLGTYKSPIGDLEVKGLTADISAGGAGGRVFECHANDSLEISDVTIEGEHDTAGKGPMLVGVHSSGGSGTVSNVSMPDGGADVSGGRGGTGLLVSNYHTGSVTIRDCHIGPFPDNGIYCSNSSGDVHVEGGFVENTNVAGVRLDGDDCSLTGTEFVYDTNISGFGGQRPVRCDGGDIEIDDIHVDMSINQTEAIRVMSGAQSVSIEDCSMDLHGDVRDGISVVSGAGPVTTNDNDINGEARYDVFEY
ncbi:hypothetical protein [Halalkalicoccus ordinarius]|uniref:hypothetical protein n=1 Tax=Halalkalicoccus ordinarius TaxID=3116651 RepID=UPI00300F56BA